MSLKEFFRSELDFLKRDGQHFSKIYPHLSRFLSDEIVDPEAERIIEFSFFGQIICVLYQVVQF